MPCWTNFDVADFNCMRALQAWFNCVVVVVVASCQRVQRRSDRGHFCNQFTYFATRDVVLHSEIRVGGNSSAIATCVLLAFTAVLYFCRYLRKGIGQLNMYRLRTWKISILACFKWTSRLRILSSWQRQQFVQKYIR